MKRALRSRTGVVLVALGLLLAPAAAADTRSGEFLALSYNVAGLPELISGSEPATNSSLISPLLNDYDLVLLQEDWAEPHEVFEPLPVFFYHHEIVAEADHPYRSEPAPHPLGTDLRRVPSGPTLVSDGLNRLSRFPFGQLTREMWEVCHGDLIPVVAEEATGAIGIDGPIEDAGLGALIDGGSGDCLAQKGFSVARTEFGPGVEVEVYNLHADAGGGPADQEARADNFRQLASFIDEHSAGSAIILGGDTNLNTERRPRDAEVWDEFRATTGLIDVCEAVDCGEDAHVIDKFAFRSGGGVEIQPLSHSFEREKFQRDDGEPLSDHDALAVMFRWTVAAPQEEAVAVAAAADAVPPMPATGGPGSAPFFGAVLAALSAAGLLATRRERPAR